MSLSSAEDSPLLILYLNCVLFEYSSDLTLDILSLFCTCQIDKRVLDECYKEDSNGRQINNKNLNTLIKPKKFHPTIQSFKAKTILIVCLFFYFFPVYMIFFIDMEGNMLQSL